MSGVDVLLATYNGARFLPEQLRSIDAQTYQNLRVLVRDDGSSDETPDILRNWAASSPHECVFISDEDKGLGACGNFGRLLEASDRPYFMFCDQDDVWEDNKVELAAKTIQATEVDLGMDTPALAHCDLRVVDETLAVSAASFWKTQSFGSVSVLRDGDASLVRRNLLIRNFVTGCAMIGNAALRQQALPIPDDSAMHDWWLALVAGFSGEIRAIETPGIRYRQHGSNSLGAKDWSAAGVAKRALTEPRAAMARTRRWIGLAKLQARHLIDLTADDLPEDDLACLREFADLNNAGIFARKTFMARHRITAQSRFHTAITWLVL